MTTYTFPIVGAHFRPPAKGILATLRGQTPLRIVPEPSNAVDENALAVFVLVADIESDLDEELDANCQGYGYQASDIREQGAWHLGYIPAKEALPLAPIVLQHYKGDLENADINIEAILSFDAKGKPCATFSLD
jgi:hypothetical protein